MTRKLLVAAAAIALAACSSDGQTTNATALPTTTAQPATTSPTPVSAAVPTTTGSSAPPTTTASPTVAPPTAPPTTAPAGNPAEIAVAEVTTRLNNYWAAMDRCFEAPNDCDPDAIVTEYADPTTPIATWFLAWVNEYQAKGLRDTRTELIIRNLITAVPTPDGESVLTTQCITNGSVVVEGPPENSVVADDAVGYSRAEMSWTRTEGRWTVTGSSFIKLDESGDQSCAFD